MKTSSPVFVCLLFIAISVLAAACVSVKAAPPLVLPPVYQSGEGPRGSLADAIPLAIVSADEAAGYLDPVAISTRIKPDMLVKAGFFTAVKRLKPDFSLVRQVRIHYWSVDPRGRPIQLSGLLLLPALPAGAKRDVPLVLICHGTQLLRERVPSRLAGAERIVGLVAAATGMAVVLPDYPGLGDGEGFHPYCLAGSLAAAGLDALRASRQYLREYSAGTVSENGQVYVGGYSEGGYAAMAVLREIETRGMGEFALQAGYPMAVPADMSGTMRQLMTGDQPASSPYFLLYTLLGWQSFYPGTFDLPSLLKPEALTGLLPLVDGLHSSLEVNAAIAKQQGVKPELAVASRMLSDAALAALRDPDASVTGQRLRAALVENDLYDWAVDPLVPLFLAASPTDEMVPAANSLLVAARLGARGGQVELTILSPNTHADAGIEAYALMLLDLWKRNGILVP